MSADESKQPATPGRPESKGSRQQTHADQVLQSGSPELDRRSAGAKGPNRDQAHNAIYHDRPAEEGTHGDGDEEPNSGTP
jgi:hypothetical protein